MEDKDIVEMYWQRDEDAIKVTDLQYGRVLRNVSYQIVKDYEDSQECVDDTYLRAWFSMPPKRPMYLCAFLAKITRNLSIDCYRRKHAERRVENEYALSLDELGECVSQGNVTEDQVAVDLLGEDISRFLRTLDENECKLFIRRYFFCDSLKEAAAFCGYRENNAKTVLFRTRQDLKAFLIKEGYDL